MTENESTLHQLREHYALIFNWHRQQGPRRYREKFEGQIDPDDKWYRKYMHLLEQMPHPIEANPEAIALVAHEVLTGCMEWSYVERVHPDLSMSEVAKAIKGMLKELSAADEERTVIKKLKTLQSMGEAGAAPSSVEVLVPLTAFQPGDRMYLEYARLAYDDVPTPQDDVNMGGFVVLTDTNIESQTHHKLEQRFRNEDITSLLFRNARALHLIEDESENSLVGLAKSGAISILSVKIGGRD